MERMKLTILGCQGPYPGAGKATSGYLLEGDGVRLLLDCGSGVLGRLQNHLPPGELSAIFISHFHYDHWADLPVLRYLLEGGRRRAPLPLFLPAGAPEEKELAQGWAFAPRPVVEESLTFGPWELSFLRTKHPVPCYAIRVTGKRRFAYSADTGWSEELPEFFRGADLLLCEAALQEAKGSGDVHLTPGQAGAVAAAAEVGRLLLTHLPPEREGEAALREARENYPASDLVGEGEVHEF